MRVESVLVDVISLELLIIGSAILVPSDFYELFPLLIRTQVGMMPCAFFYHQCFQNNDGTVLKETDVGKL